MKRYEDVNNEKRHSNKTETEGSTRGHSLWTPVPAEYMKLLEMRG